MTTSTRLKGSLIRIDIIRSDWTTERVKAELAEIKTWLLANAGAEDVAWDWFFVEYVLDVTIVDEQIATIFKLVKNDIAFIDE